MNKQCANCTKVFKTKDSRQKSCSKPCADKRRVVNASRSSPSEKESSYDLPPVEDLPAPYVKQVHDMWEALIGNKPTRIA